MNYRIVYSDELYHHGVKGMKWGVRKDNPNYSTDQRNRDKTIYGSSGVRRINRSMNAGHNISSARSKEADRIHSFRRAAVVGGKVGATVGAIGGAAVGRKIIKRHGNDLLDTSSTAAAIGVGAPSVGTALGRYGGQSIVMLAGGYSPKKFRYD